MNGWYPEKVITDLVQIRRLGEQKRGENERLRKHLKRHSMAERRIRRMAEEIEVQFDCLQCANCCKVATVGLFERDVAKLAKHMRIPPAAFVREYTEISAEEGLILRRTADGCVFLDGHHCQVYEARPGNCEDFPHTVRGDGSFISRMWDFTDRACYCPIVYNTLEALKEEVGFRR
jgi:Fe-S-cluster containining protein